MTSHRPIAPTRRVDPLIDEVRANRRRLVESFDNDLDRLAAHLRRVQTDYENRTGQFADLPLHIRKEPFPAMNHPLQDPTRDEVQALRIAARPKTRPRPRRQP
jgi:hypothetical protein